MNEEPTRELPDKRSFEERVFARLDVIDARLQALEARAVNTKPIWESALAEIHEVKQGVAELKDGLGDIKRKFEILIEDVLQVRTDQRRVERRMDALESRP